MELVISIALGVWVSIFGIITYYAVKKEYEEKKE